MASPSRSAGDISNPPATIPSAGRAPSGVVTAEPLERYLAYDDIREWLLTPCTMTERKCPGALQCAFRMEMAYSQLATQSVQLGTQMHSPVVNVENLFVPAGCNGRFIMGTLYGDSHPHIVLAASDAIGARSANTDAHNPIYPHPLDSSPYNQPQHETCFSDGQQDQSFKASTPEAFCRRFCVDLACQNGLEFVEVSWLRDGRVLVQTCLIQDHGVLDSTVFVFGQSTAGFLSSNISRVCKIADSSLSCASCAQQRRMCSCLDVPRGSPSKFQMVRSWHGWTDQLKALRNVTAVIESQPFDMKEAKFLDRAYLIVETNTDVGGAPALEELKKKYVTWVYMSMGIPKHLIPEKAKTITWSCDENVKSVCYQEIDLEAITEGLQNKVQINQKASKSRRREYEHEYEYDYGHNHEGDDELPGQSRQRWPAHKISSLTEESLDEDNLDKNTTNLGISNGVPHQYHPMDSYKHVRPSYGDALPSEMLTPHTQQPVVLSQEQRLQHQHQRILQHQQRQQHRLEQQRMQNLANINNKQAIPEMEALNEPALQELQELQAPSHDCFTMVDVMHCPACTPLELCPQHAQFLYADDQVPDPGELLDSILAGSLSADRTNSLDDYHENGSASPKEPIARGGSKSDSKTQGDGKARHYCPECGASFSTTSNKRKHFRAVHLGEKPFPCDVCGMSFAQSSDRNRHYKSRHPEHVLAQEDDESNSNSNPYGSVSVN